LPSTQKYTTTTPTPNGSEQEIIVQEKGFSRVLTLNRPKALNSLNLTMVRKMTSLYKQYEQDPKVSNIILKGSGRAFCAGGDIVAIYHGIEKGDSITSDFFREEYILDYIIANLKRTPPVAFLDGITMGGGVGVSVHGKYKLATENSVFSMPEAAIGFFCDVGGSYFLPRLKGQLGMFLALTGARLKGPQLFTAGIASHYVQSSSLPQLEEQLGKVSDAEQIDKLLQQYHIKDTGEAGIINNMEDINNCFAKDSVEQIFKALDDHKSKWSQSTTQMMKGACPLSLRIIFKQLKEGAKLSFAECLKMEYRLSQAFMQCHDFREGVRALLVDKDKLPKWTESNAPVDTFFKSLPNHLELVLNQNKL